MALLKKIVNHSGLNRFKIKEKMKQNNSGRRLSQCPKK
jgi:hypothetical protein